MFFSVVIPLYNKAYSIQRCIDSVLNQSYTNFEIIVVNDGSIDKSLELIERYKKHDERIVLISRENRGLIASLNEGIALAKGEYIARMDADDISILNRFELQYNFMLKNDLDICGGDFISIDELGNYVKINSVPKTKDEILITMANNAPFAHPTVMIKSEFLKKTNLVYGVYGNKAAEDVDLWINMYNNGANFGNLNEIVLKYRILTSSYSHKNAKILKKEVNMQFDAFVLKHRQAFSNSIENIFNSDIVLSYTQEKNLMKCVLRYSHVNIEFKYIFNIFKKIKLKSFLIGLLAYMTFFVYMK